MSQLEGFGETAKQVLAAVCEGRYGETEKIMTYSDPGRYPAEVAGLAEAMGLALVKLEARELGLEQAADELRGKNAELEKLLKQRREFSLFFILFAVFIGLYTLFSAYLYQPGLFTLEELSWMRPASGAAFAVVLLALAAITGRCCWRPSSSASPIPTTPSTSPFFRCSAASSGAGSTRGTERSPGSP